MDTVLYVLLALISAALFAKGVNVLMALIKGALQTYKNSD